MIPRAAARGGWLAAIQLALSIAVIVAALGALFLILFAGQSVVDALVTVLPGAAIGAGASLVLALLGSRRGRVQAQLDRMDEEDRRRGEQTPPR